MKIMQWLAGCALIVLLMWGWSQHAQHNTPRDDTDPPGERSGLQLFTDHKTGLQYLGNPRGGLWPRLDVDGTHMRAGDEHSR